MQVFCAYYFVLLPGE